LLRADHPDSEAALAALVGPLALFRWSDEPSAADPTSTDTVLEPEALPPWPPDAGQPEPTPVGDFADPRAWSGVEDVGEPEPLHFTGRGPHHVPVIEVRSPPCRPLSRRIAA